MSIRLVNTTCLIALTTAFGGCAVLGDARSDAGGARRIENLQMLKSALGSYAAARSPGVSAAAGMAGIANSGGHARAGTAGSYDPRCSTPDGRPKPLSVGPGYASWCTAR